jgi:hypothetical protein
MTVLPLPRWVIRTRKVILWVGLCWPILVVVLTDAFAKHGAVDWAIIGILFLTTIFAPISLVSSLFLPTYKWRIIGVPPVLVGVFWLVSSQSYNYKGFSIPPYMLLWITTFTAIALLIPQHSTAALFVCRIFRRP